MTTWHDRAFSELSASELYAILALRSQVFVVEQSCVYLDIDGRDQACRHVFATFDDGELAAYLRVRLAGPLAGPDDPADPHPDAVWIGRVVVAPSARGTGLARTLMSRGLASAYEHFGRRAIQLSAQVYLRAFYESLGFVAEGAPYDDAGIPHVHMLRASAPRG